MQTLNLNKKMVEFGDTYADLAPALDMSVQTLCNKMSGITEFNRKEIETIIKRYKLNSKEVMDIFFTQKCTKNKQSAK